MNTDFLWVEEYRPKTIDDCILPQSLKTLFTSFVQKGELSNLLLSGTSGIGKTTVAKALCEQLNCDWIMINGSEEGGIDVLRNKIKNFASTVSLSGGKKVVILDEADYLNPQSTQPALRGFVEEFHKNCRFILTCNYQERIIDPIISRCQSFSLNPPSQKNVAIHLASILKNEGIDFELEDIKTLVVCYYPDIRKIINTAQLFSKNSKLTLDVEQLIGSDVKLNMMSTLLESSQSILNRFKAIREMIHANGIRDFSEFYNFVYENLDKFSEDIQPMIILQLADAQHRDAFVVDKEINFSACIYNILKLFKE